MPLSLKPRTARVHSNGKERFSSLALILSTQVKVICRKCYNLDKMFLTLMKMARRFAYSGLVLIPRAGFGVGNNCMTLIMTLLS